MTRIPTETRVRCELCGAERKGGRGLTVVAEHLDGEGLTVPEYAVCSSDKECKKRARKGTAGRKTT